MYKTVNGHGPEICKESFHDISSIHGHATRSAVKGDLFVPRKATSIAQQAVSVAGPRIPGGELVDFYDGGDHVRPLSQTPKYVDQIFQRP